MNHPFFIKQIDRLKSQQGWQNAYGQERMDVIWNWSKTMRDETFERIITIAIADCERAPLLKNLKEIYPQVKSQLAPVRKTLCHHCDDRGQILGMWRADLQNIDAYEDFACPFCDPGRKMKHLRFWQEQHLEKFIPKFANNQIPHGNQVLSVHDLIQQVVNSKEISA